MPEPGFSWRRRTARSARIAICAVMGIAATGIAVGQAKLIARRSSEITTFGEFTYLRPDFGADPNVGFSTGVDFTPYIPMLLEPSLEMRFSNAGGAMNTERTFSAGLKLALRLHRFHPYGTFEEGAGIIYFKHPILNYRGVLYTRDASRMHVVGGGVEVDVRDKWQVKLDCTEQFWDLRPPPIQPITASIGVTYRIPFRNGRMK